MYTVPHETGEIHERGLCLKNDNDGQQRGDMSAAIKQTANVINGNLLYN